MRAGGRAGDGAARVRCSGSESTMSHSSSGSGGSVGCLACGAAVVRTQRSRGKKPTIKKGGSLPPAGRRCATARVLDCWVGDWVLSAACCARDALCAPVPRARHLSASHYGSAQSASRGRGACTHARAVGCGAAQGRRWWEKGLRRAPTHPAHARVPPAACGALVAFSPQQPTAGWVHLQTAKGRDTRTDLVPCQRRERHDC